MSVSDTVAGVGGIYLLTPNGLYHTGNPLSNVYSLRTDACIPVTFTFSRVAEWVKSICER